METSEAGYVTQTDQRRRQMSSVERHGGLLRRVKEESDDGQSYF